MARISKLYHCGLYDLSSCKTLQRVDKTTIVCLRVNDFAKLCAAGFRVIVYDYCDYLAFAPSYYNTRFRRAARVANYIIINRKLPPKL